MLLVVVLVVVMLLLLLVLRLASRVVLIRYLSVACCGLLTNRAGKKCIEMGNVTYCIN